MDCEKFDRIVLDLLYEELDEITAAAARRHMEHCTRCRDIATRLRATREVGTLPLVDPPEGLELRILDAERRARRELPARQRVGRWISMLAGYAMRPQLAMAALLLLVIGSSLLLLRARPGAQKSVLVTERGVPEGEPEIVAVVPRANGERPSKPKLGDEVREERRSEPRASERAPASATSGRGEALRDDDSASANKAVEADRAYEDALGAYRDRKYDEAQRRFTEVAARGGENAASAALYAAQSARARAGCPTAAALFDEVHRKYPDSQPGHEAVWQAAGCYRMLGDFERARLNYQSLLSTPGYADRSQAALASLGEGEQSAEIARRAAARAKERSPAKAGAPAAAKPPVEPVHSLESP